MAMQESIRSLFEIARGAGIGNTRMALPRLVEAGPFDDTTTVIADT